MKSLNTNQIRAILNHARKTSTRDWCLFLLTFRHAMRSHEVRQLKLSDVNLTTGSITVERGKRKDADRIQVQELDRHRGEPLLDSMLALRLWLKERVEDGSQILFPSQKGGMLTRMQMLRLFKRYCVAAGIPDDLAHPHVLRHSLCTVMAEQHADLYSIQKRAGHKSIASTMIYTHITDAQASEACQSALMAAFA